MKNNRLATVFVSAVLCLVFLAIPAANAYAMPLNAAAQYASGAHPISVAVGDFNGDGKPDLAVANETGANTVSILLGNGNGTFILPAVPYPVGTWPRSVASGDFNGDGKLDLATANDSSGNVSVLLGNGDGTFGTKTDFGAGTRPFSVAVGDFNKDGKPDLVTANYGSLNVSVLLGNGNGTFGTKTDYPTSAATPNCVVVGDFNLDSIPDLATANETSGSVSILIGNGSGAFAAPIYIGVGHHCTSLALGDFNGDGKPDLAVADYGDGNVAILLGNGNGTFILHVHYPLGTGPLFLAVGDFNMDGKPDLATANYVSSNSSMLLGVGDGTFGTPTTCALGGITPYHVAVGDFNMDGAPDLVTANYGSANVSVLLNTPEPPTISAVNPASGLQGQSLLVIITGSRFAGTPTASYGTGITVNSITVNSLTQITASITIAAGATAGVRNISVTTPGGTATKTGGFTVIEVPQNTMIGTGAPTSHGSSVSAPTSPAPPVSLPNMVIQSASISAKSVTPGTPITVTADIANKSAVNGNKKVTLYVNGQVETTQGITVNSGGSTQLTFNVSRSEPGDYSVYVDGVPAGSFKVELFSATDGILVFSAGLVALAFIVGMVMLWRRQRAV